VEAFPSFLVIVIIVGLVLGMLLAFLTGMRVRTVALWCVTVLFVVGWISWFSLELALLGAVIAALPSVAGARVGKNMKSRWSN
jgi:hypothetical protein